MPPPFVRPFHFWCQKVLPLVFDDSLSYYEVLAKMRDYLNNAINEINRIGGEFEEVKQQLTQLQTYVDEYFAGLDVNQAISDKLDNMVESGEMDAVITPIFAAYANPLFAASVADMVATNFAYANYENNKIYTFNQSTGLYQTTGKEFGGVVSSVDEMEDNDKYYALDSDGMLYSYDFPQAAFVATGLTYGGYRYGVNAMRPISNAYVLTTDSHVYTWNGSEYVDSGVVYGLNNTAFIWRRELSSTDNITLLVTDGWYYFKSDSLPMGLPVNMETSDGFAVVYSIPNDTDNSDNVRSEATQDVQTQRTQNIRADSRNKRIALRTNKGGSWFWNGLTWVDENEIGFQVCENCNNINWNSVLICDENTLNKPVNENGTLKTFANENTCQLFYSSTSLYFRANTEPWNEISTTTDIEHAISLINQVSNANQHNAELLREAIFLSHENALRCEQEIAFVKNAFGDVYSTAIKAENGLMLISENGYFLIGEMLSVKTDLTLTNSNMPANSLAVGEAFNRENEYISNVSDTLNIYATQQTTINAHLQEQIDNAYSGIRTLYYSALLTNSETAIFTENGYGLQAQQYGVTTDSTLTKENMAANSKAVGDRLGKIQNDISIINASANKDTSKLDNDMSKIMSTLHVTKQALDTESGLTIANNDNYAISFNVLMPKTSTSISALPPPLSELDKYSKKIDYNNYTSFYQNVNIAYQVPVIKVIGELPTTKTNVTVYCTITLGSKTIYDDTAKIKVQGNSSLSYPVKNYTLNLNNAISLWGYTLKKWNLKVNYQDPTQLRNIVCARLWYQTLRAILPGKQDFNITTQNSMALSTESNDSLVYSGFTMKIQQAPMWGASDGNFCYLIHNGDFHGVYTCQIPKDETLFNMRTNSFIVNLEQWTFKHIDSVDGFDSALSIEYASDTITKEAIIDKLNALIDVINLPDGEFETAITGVMNKDITIAYICHAIATNNYDGLVKNMNLYSYDGGNTIDLSVWDMDSTISNSARPFVIALSGHNPIAPESTTQLCNAETGFLSLSQRNTVQEVINSNSLFLKFWKVFKTQIYEQYKALINTTLSGRMATYNARCLLLGVSNVMLYEHFRKWGMTPKTNELSAGLLGYLVSENNNACLEEMEELING